MGARLLACIDVKDFAAETVRIGDLNGDGAPDLLFVQSVYPTREITCLTATTIRGELLWQSGEPSAENGRIYSDLPVQIYDWDNDGRNEVLYVKQARYATFELTAGWARERASHYEGSAELVVLDSTTGKVKTTFKLPAPADDCLVFADLTGRGRREELVIKDRYWNIWGIGHHGEELWKWTGSTGHYPTIADLDGDGKDEVFVGFALLDHDGRPLFEHPDHGQHQDAAYIHPDPVDGWRLFYGNGGVHCLTVNGRQVWHHPLNEAQHVIVGTFRKDSPYQCAVVNRGQPKGGERDPAELLLFDRDGRELWRRPQPTGSWAAAAVKVDWMGPGAPACLLVYARGGEPAVIYDGNGEIIDTLPMQYTSNRSDTDRRASWYGLSADVWGDGRQEVLLSGSRGACIYTNARPYAPPALYNFTLYPGM